MHTQDAIGQRLSVKAFDPSHRLTSAEETRILEAAIPSPTSYNMQNSRFVIVRDPELRKRMGAAAVGKAVKPAMPKGGQLALSEVLVQDRFA